jgi:hypothetical protein
MAAPRTRRVRKRSLVDEWKRADSEPVHLPSGWWARIREPNVADIVRAGATPATLLRILIDEKAPELDEKAGVAIAEETATFVDTFARMSIIELSRDGEHFERVHLSAEDFDALPDKDKIAMRQIVTHETTPAIVTAYSDYRAGALTEDEAVALIEKEASRTPAGWATFRQLTERALGGGDGANVVRPPKFALGDHRPARRVRAR